MVANQPSILPSHVVVPLIAMTIKAPSARNAPLPSLDAQCHRLLEDLCKNAHIISYSTVLI